MTGLVGLALLASVFFGVSDFLGGTLSRKLPMLTVLFLSQIVAIVSLTPQAIVDPYDFSATPSIMWGLIAGFAAAIAVSSLFKALAIGTMGVIAPITSLSVLVPVAVGLFMGDQLTLILGLGLAAAVIGTVLASGPEINRAAPSAGGGRAVLLGGVAAIFFGVANLAIALGSATSVTTTLLTDAVTVLVLYSIGLLIFKQVPKARGLSLVGIAAIGVLGFAANISFAFASLSGALSVVAVLASLYPVITALLGWRIHKERLMRIQIVGVLLVLAGVAAIAATS
ncbi:hypothetical protein A20C1_06201 [marine actinobacterium PHSC20C1]|nr:hypothetical protein A20C1_06201 [marine actinobacterium PHSC20C1]